MAMTIFSASSSSWLSTKGRTIALALAISCLLSVVLVVGLRRLMGALGEPLSAGAMALTLFGALFAGMFWRWLWLSLRAESQRPLLIPTVFIVLLAVALWLPGTSSAAVVVLCCAIALDAAAVLAFRWGGHQRLRNWMSPRQGHSARLLVFKPHKPRDDDDLPAHVSQRFTRRRLPDGGEVIEGQLRASLLRGQRAEFCHVAFCPPLEGIARVTCEQKQGPPARIKVAQVLPQGARIEIRLTEILLDTTEVVLSVSACCDPPPCSPSSPPAADPGIGQQAQDGKQ